MTGQDPVLELKEWSCGYLDEPIVRSFDLGLEPGSITCVIGSNGAGKSTLLRSIFGTAKRFHGTLTMRGKPLHRLTPAARMAQGLSLVPQGRCNFAHLSVAENMQLAAYTLERSAANDAIQRQLSSFPVLQEKSNLTAGNLSGGEQQMLEMAMVLVAEPAVLLVDEPSLGLSPKMMSEVFQTIRSLAGKGIAILMVEQNIRGGLAVSDRAVVMDLGRKVMEGDPVEVIEDERIRSVFLGGAPANATGD